MRLAPVMASHETEELYFDRISHSYILKTMATNQSEVLTDDECSDLVEKLTYIISSIEMKQTTIEKGWYLNFPGIHSCKIPYSDWKLTSVRTEKGLSTFVSPL
jgi:hypothetical protein